jgi:methyl acetate hydrolase
MLRRVVFIALVAGLPVIALVGATPHAQGAGRPAPSVSLDEKLSAAVARGDVPGLVVMAATKDRIVYTGVFGTAETGQERQMTADAIFRIASMTKPVTSVAAMQLFEQGLFALDDPAEKYLPELANLSVFESFDAVTGAYKVRPAATKVTIRHLFTHTSGLGYSFTSAIDRDFKPREGEKYAAGPLLFEPGTQWIYGDSVEWLGRLVEKLSGKSLEEYFRERIFTPLGMADTFYNVPEAKQARRVTVHRRKDGRADAPPTEQPNQPQRPSTKFGGGGGLWSTAGDYIRFERMILNGGTLDGVRILSAASIALMGRNQIGDLEAGIMTSAQPARSNDVDFFPGQPLRWGLASMINLQPGPNGRSAGSLSWAGLFNSYFWIDPTRRVTGVIMMQILPFADPRAVRLYGRFERAVYDALT